MSTPNFSISDLSSTIIAHADQALANYGRKNYVETAQFVDIILDIRKLATHISDLTVFDHLK